MINQAQLFFLLFLTRAFLPIDVKTIISGVSIVLNFPSYIPFENIAVYKSLIDYFNLKLSNHALEDVKIYSDSTIKNSSPFFWSIIIVVLFHFFVFIFAKFLSKWRPIGRWACFTKMLQWIFSKMLIMLTFGYYIRAILEMNQYLLISLTNELYYFHHSNTAELVSLVFAFFILSMCILIILIVLYLIFKMNSNVQEGKSMLGEFFSGVKLQRKFRLYVVFLLARRIIFVVLLITLVSVPSRILIWIVGLIQLWYIIYISVLRPFKEIKWCLIEISNEVFFIILLIPLSYFNYEDDWKSTFITIYCCLV